MQVLELVERLVVLRVEGEDLLVRAPRRVRVLRLVAPHVGGAAQLLDFFRVVAEGLGALHLHVDDVGPALLGAVERLERVESLEVGADLEQLPPRLGGVVRLLQGLAVGLAELAEDLLELVLVEHRRRAVHHLVERLHELARVVPAAMDRRDASERREVRVVDVEDAVPVLERLVVAPQLVAEYPRPRVRMFTRSSSASAMSICRSRISPSLPQASLRS